VRWMGFRLCALRTDMFVVPGYTIRTCHAVSVQGSRAVRATASTGNQAVWCWGVCGVTELLLLLLLLLLQGDAAA
jgi:hypothetical protein